MLDTKQPLISCVMPTYGRPDFVHEAADMFLRQDYAAKELIILNDCAGQKFDCKHPNIRVINSATRYPTLGEKRNACIEATRGELIAVWDDDDVYLPWRLSYSLQELNRWQTPFYRPREFWAYWGEEQLHDNQSVPGWIGHPSVMFQKQLWSAVGGYPARGLGEDAEFFQRIHSYLRQEFIAYSIDRCDRFMILRGASQYQHMSIAGGQAPLDVSPGNYPIVARSIADAKLRNIVSRLAAQRNTATSPIIPAATAGRRAAEPILSVCISLKNRSKVSHEGEVHTLFPNCVRALQEAAEVVGPLELVVADFHSDDWPLGDWIMESASRSLQIRVLTLDGPFSRGRGLNAAVNVASSRRIFICDADILVSAEALTRGIASLDRGQAAFPICQYLDARGQPDFWQDSGFGIAFVSREHFQRAGGVPEFLSWGGEDDLFYKRLQDLSTIVRQRDAGLRHQWHCDASRHENYCNRPRFDFKALQQSNSKCGNATAAYRTFRGEHPCWAGVGELRLYADGHLERPGFDSGRFELKEKQLLILKWHRWPPERLIWNASRNCYGDPRKPFVLREVSPERPRGPSELLHIRSKFAELAEQIKSLSRFQFVWAPGNWGDAIIRSGTLLFFQQLGVSYTQITDPTQADPSLPAVLSGSGGFCKFWNWSPWATKMLLQRCPKVIVLPSSYEAASLDLASESGRLMLYAREMVSYAQVQSRYQSAFCPDMAFWNQPADCGAAIREELLNAFRTDRESRGYHLNYTGNRDISLECDHLGDSRRFFQEIAAYARVCTDRTHVAIAAAMLGRPVDFFPNAYHKNESLFESTLHGFNVTWHPATTGERQNQEDSR